MLNITFQTEKNKFGVRPDCDLDLTENWNELYVKERILEPLTDVYLSSKQDYVGTKKDSESNVKMFEAEKVSLIEDPAENTHNSNHATVRQHHLFEGLYRRC